MVEEFNARLRREREEREKLLQENMKMSVQLRATERELTEMKNKNRKQELDLIGRDDTIYSLNVRAKDNIS